MNEANTSVGTLRCCSWLRFILGVASGVFVGCVPFPAAERTPEVQAGSWPPQASQGTSPPGSPAAGDEARPAPPRLGPTVTVSAKEGSHSSSRPRAHVDADVFH